MLSSLPRWSPHANTALTAGLHALETLPATGGAASMAPVLVCPGGTALHEPRQIMQYLAEVS